MTKVSKHPLKGLGVHEDEHGVIRIVTPGLFRNLPVASYVDSRYQHVFAAAPEMLAALEAIVELAGEAYQHWDADREMKVGKILLALSGNLSGYHPRIDAVHALIDKTKGEQG